MEKTSIRNKRWPLVAFPIIAAILLIMASSALWFNNYIFNTNNFTQTATTALLSESSRQAIGDEIATQAFSGRPILSNALGDFVSHQVAAILGTNFAKNTVTRVVTKLQTTITSNNPQNIAIDISGIKSNMNKIVTVAESLTNQSFDQADSTLNQLPDQIVLVNASNLPNIYHMGVALLWIGPLALILAIILLALPIWWRWGDRLRLAAVLAIDGAAIVIAGILAVILGPLFRPAILGSVNSANLRIVVGNIYNAFMSKFSQQSEVLFLVGAILLLLALGLLSWDRYKVYKTSQSAT